MRARTAITKSIEHDSVQSRVQVAAIREHLSTRLTAWIAAFPDYMPRVPLTQKGAEDTPEDFGITLPSSFSTGKRRSLGLETIAGHELELRLDQAREALLELRVSIQRFSIAVDEKRGKRSERGQKATTRMEGQIRNLQQSVQRAAKNYRTIYKALVSLGLSPDNKHFRPLKDADTSGSRRIWRELALGQGRKKVPWIWTVPLGFDTSNAQDWNREGELTPIPFVLASANLASLLSKSRSVASRGGQC